MRERFLIIHNPNTGQIAQRLYRETIFRLRRSGASAEILETARHGEGKEAAAAWSECFDAVVAAGGDGTVHDVAEGLIGHSTPLGIIPIGTGNVFAREMNLPRSPAAITKTLLKGDICALPVGKVNDRVFLFVVGVGFDAEAVCLFETESTRRLGQAGFIWPVLRALFSDEDRPLRVVTPAGERQAGWVIVTRAKHYAGNLIIAPDANLHESALHVLSMAGAGRLNRLRQLSALAMGWLRYDPEAQLERTDHVRIEGDRNVPVQIDGEASGELPLELSLHPHRLKVIWPAR